MQPWTLPPSDERRPKDERAPPRERSGGGTGRGAPKPELGGFHSSAPEHPWSRRAPSTLSRRAELRPTLSPANALHRVAFRLLLPSTDRSPAP